MLEVRYLARQIYIRILSRVVNTRSCHFLSLLNRTNYHLSFFIYPLISNLLRYFIMDLIYSLYNDIFRLNTQCIRMTILIKAVHKIITNQFILNKFRREL